jgi:glycine/D-amino acid oxidase-like deaminating enzyme/nitrite reductase/ring-hydroxylating ferredoxin subunit
MDRPSLWIATARPPPFPSLDTSLSTDVTVVGGGIAGVTAALLLQRAGAEVVLLEARRIAARETGRSTAHLTEVLDTRYHALESSFGADAASAAAASSRAAIDRIEAIAGELDAPCGFARVPGFLVARDAAQRRELERELPAMLRAGLDAGWTDALPWPLEHAGAVRVERQARFHPVEYLRELVARAQAAGVRVFEGTRVREVRDGRPCSVLTDRGSVVSGDVLVLTNQPVSGRFGVHMKIAAYRTYAVALGPVPPDPERADGLLWDLDDPYHHVRAHETPGGTFVIVGGEDHKTGHEGASPARFAALEAWARPLVGDAPVAHRWSGQIIVPADGLPFIGRHPGAGHVHDGTGFSGNGMTFGTLAGMILADAVQRVPNPWAALYDARRVRPLAQARRFVAANADVAARLARDRLRRGEPSDLATLPRGEGRLVREGGKVLAVSRREDGSLCVRSAVCPHLGCHVQWNSAERSWDCPCHGSRYEATGAVLNGPTTRELDQAEGVVVPLGEERT